MNAWVVYGTALRCVLQFRSEPKPLRTQVIHAVLHSCCSKMTYSMGDSYACSFYLGQTCHKIMLPLR